MVLAVSMLIGMLSASAVAISGSTVVDALIAQEELQFGREGSYALGITDPAALTRTAFTEPESQFVAASRSYQELSDGAPFSVGFLLDGEAALRGINQTLGESANSVSTRWLDGAFSDFFRFPIVTGDELSERSILPPEININERAAREYGLSAGEAVILTPAVERDSAGVCPAGGIEFTVAGVVADAKDLPQIYGSLSFLEALCPDGIAQQAVELRWVAAAQAGEIEKLLRETLDRYLVAHDADVRRADTVADATSQIRLVNMMFAITGGLMLIVTIIAIANVGISTVRERSVELSIRQAFGATPKHIVAQVLGGSLLLGICVAMLGVVATLLGVYVVLPQMIPAASALGAPVFPWEGCLTAIVSALGAAAVGGLIPAWFALRLPVAVILRR